LDAGTSLVTLPPCPCPSPSVRLPSGVACDPSQVQTFLENAENRARYELHTSWRDIADQLRSDGFQVDELYGFTKATD